MNFIEAVKAMEEGKWVKRAIWGRNDKMPFLKLVNKKSDMPYEVIKSSQCFSIDDFEATDWEVVE